jgi:hypothetical protein
MKSKLSKILQLVFGLVILILGCTQSKNSPTNNNEIEILKPAILTKKEGVIVSKYDDGRYTEVRTLTYYDFYKDTIQAIKNDSLKLILVITEWNKYEALVADKEAAFTQIPNNTMVGGDVETNNRIKKDAVKYFEMAKALFEKEINTIQKVDFISNRNTDNVTIDFVTNKGLYTVQIEKNKLESNQSIWSNLFNETKKMSILIEKTFNSNEWREKQ